LSRDCVALEPSPRTLDSQARPFPDLRHAHAAVRLPAHRDLVEPGSSVQAGTESVAAALVRTHAPNDEMLTDFQPVEAVGDLAICARLLDPSTEVGVFQRDAVLVAARSIDNLTRRNGAVRVDPVAPPSPVCGGRVGDHLAVAV
jgi:hypothetical protein